MFFRAYLGWSLNHVAQNYLFIAMLCAKMSRVNKAKELTTDFTLDRKCREKSNDFRNHIFSKVHVLFEFFENKKKLQTMRNLRKI